VTNHFDQQEFHLTGGSTKGVQGGYKRCYETHPALPLGDGLVIYGGSCGYPVVLDADVYVGLDGYSMMKTKKSFPWEPGYSFAYPIVDMQAPSDASSFIKLIDWLQEQIVAGKKVHVGCIGGHGRTGTVLSALVAVMMGNKDSTAYVRKNYCEKAVESHDQIEFLHKHFGITKIGPTKGGMQIAHSPREVRKGGSVTNLTHTKPIVSMDSRSGPPKERHNIKSCKNDLSIWGGKLVLDISPEHGKVSIAANCTNV
jgi:hypothetical protein